MFAKKNSKLDRNMQASKAHAKSWLKQKVTGGPQEALSISYCLVLA